MDKVFIRNLSIRGTHGTEAREREVEQEFLIDIEAQFDAKRAALSDNLDDTINYVRFRDIAREIVEGRSFFLIERVAAEIANTILTDMRIEEVSVTVRKPHVFESGIPGVTIVRTCQKDAND
ncbi:dihydroneopterin aldolase [Candidatus Kaiserbacteria bacterium]|nr:dihydroneopterin aldolase [Candidatus Kaiserbacteria bacterium]